MRRSLSRLRRYIATPVTAKHRIFVWVEPPTVPDITLAVFAAESDYVFGVLHSKPHELWSLRMCAWMGQGNDPRYTPTTTFVTFPFPWPPGREPADDPRVQAIAAAAADLVAKRDAWLNPTGASETERKQRTLTNLYNAWPAWLDLAHRALDAAVLAVYVWPEDLTDDEILARLLALNLARAGKQRGRSWGSGREQQAGLNIGTCKAFIFCQISASVAPCAIRFRIYSTVSRVPRTIGLPTMTRGSMAMRSSI